MCRISRLGFPGSVGVKCLAPDRPVLCFTEDGGLWYHVGELETACRCDIKTNTSLLEVKDNEVIVINQSFSKNTLKTDNVVLAVGLAPDQDLYRDLQGKIHNLYLIGESRQARNIMAGIWDAYEVARTI